MDVCAKVLQVLVCSLWGLGLTKMVLAVQKLLKMTNISIFDNLYTQKFISHSGCPGSGLTGTCLCSLWGLASPRWCWPSGKSWNQPYWTCQTAFVSTTLPKNVSLGLYLLTAYSWQSLVSRPHQDEPGCPKNVEINPPKHPKQLLFQQLCPKINP